jgi:hypothetical protein
MHELHVSERAYVYMQPTAGNRFKHSHTVFEIKTINLKLNLNHEKH